MIIPEGNENHSEYCMPPEWMPHTGTEIHWPHNRSTWPGERLHKVERVFGNIIAAIARFEPVFLFVTDLKIKERALKHLNARDDSLDWEHIHWHVVPFNDVWCRDYGPIFVKSTTDESYHITNWKFNSWGEKYLPYDGDDRIPRYVSRLGPAPRVDINMVLEGGSIDVNGVGDLLTSESVLLNPNRNPQLTRDQIEQYLSKYLGAKNFIWLESGLVGDDTDGHIDDTARFLNEETILAVRAQDSDDPNYKVLEQNYQRLQQVKSITGKSFDVVTLPLPSNTTSEPTVDGSRYVPASYANFYIANQCVLVPLYDEVTDPEALSLFETYFPEREVIGIDCKDLVWGQGSIHCVTQQWYGL
ncbi:MAG: agmatine deiminase family protein [Bacteroidota bacterium]